MTTHGGCWSRAGRRTSFSPVADVTIDWTMPTRDSVWHEPIRGRLKVFLGYASGVGKSFRMLDEGRRRRERGQDVVAGSLQPKVPEALTPLLDSLEIVPMLTVEGMAVMNIPAILDRRPQVCLVDGLAYDNPGA